MTVTHFTAKTEPRKKLKEVTWVLGDKPCRTFKNNWMLG
jgi:hypothetical protein